MKISFAENQNKQNVQGLWSLIPLTKRLCLCANLILAASYINDNLINSNTMHQYNVIEQVTFL